jgi:nitrogen fixation NifU-like protein
MNSGMLELYKALILEHHRHPRHYGVASDPTHKFTGFNQVCGDKVELFMVLSQGVIKEVTFTAKSCALCRASASIMCDFFSGMELSGAVSSAEEFAGFLAGKSDKIDPSLEHLGVVRNFSARVNCVKLPWASFLEGIGGRESLSTETFGSL